MRQPGGWVTDITYIRTHEGFLYLAVVLDLVSRQVVGWATRPMQHTDLVLQALLAAVWRRKASRLFDEPPHTLPAAGSRQRAALAFARLRVEDGMKRIRTSLFARFAEGLRPRDRRVVTPMLAGVLVSIAGPGYAQVMAQADGPWNAPATWANNAAPIPDLDYQVDNGFLVHSPIIPIYGSWATTFDGGSLTILPTGVLRFWSESPSNNALEVFSIPQFTLLDGSRLELTSATGNIDRTLTTGIALDQVGRIDIAILPTTTSAFSNSLTLSPDAPLSGGSDVAVYADAVGQSGLSRRMLSIASADNPFTGHWMVQTVNGVFGSRMGVLEAAGVRALGSGSVSLQGSVLRNAVADGISSLSAITLDAGSLLAVNARWNNPSTPLTLLDSASAVYIAHDGDTSIGALSGVSGSSVLGTLPGASLSVTNNVDSTFAGRLGATEDGSLALVKAGAGTLTLLGDNVLSGGTQIAGGTLHVGDGDQGSIKGPILNNSRLEFERRSLRVDDVISGNGELEFVGPGQLTLTADNTYTGDTVISDPAGTIVLGEGGATGSVAGNVRNDSVTGGLGFSRNADLTFTGVISGTGQVGAAGPFVLTYTGANVYSGRTLIGIDSVLQVGQGGTDGQIVGDVLVNGALRFNRADAVTYGGTIVGEGRVDHLGAGTLIFTGDHEYYGGTGIASGILQLGNGGTTGSLVGDVVNGGVLAFNRADDVIYAGTVSGGGGVSQLGPGTLTLTADHTYLGETRIQTGALRIGDGGLTGSVIGDVLNDGVLVFERETDLTFAPGIGGTGSMVKQGSNTLTLTGTHTYSGATTVSAGVLRLEGRVDSPIAVGSDATLQGNGIAGTNVVVGDGGSLAPGASVGVLTVGGNLELGANSILDYELGNPFGASDRLEVGGNLVLDGQLNVTDAGGFSSGVYRLINYGGSLTDNTLSIGTLPQGVTPGQLQIQTSVANQVNLIMVTGGFGLQFWDGAATTANSTVDGGSGVWNAASTNWTTADGAINAAWGGGFAVFLGAPGVVTLAQDLGSDGMQFASDGYRVTAVGAGVLAQPSFVVRVDAQATATLDVPIHDGGGGAAQLTKTGDGTLLLTQANTYSGGTAVTGGVLSIASDDALGSAGALLTLATGTLHTTASMQTDRPLIVDGAATLATSAGTRLSWNGPIQGEGNVAVVGPGTLTLSGSNGFTGAMAITGGSLELTSDAGLGATGNGLQLDGGTLRWLQDFDLTPARELVLGLAGGQLDTNGHTASIAQPITGPGGLIKAGEGTLVLAGQNDYAGTTRVAGGTLQIGQGGTSGRVPGDVTNNSALLFNRSDVVEFAGAISGSGRTEQRGSGTLVLTANHTYTGGTIVSAGVLQLGDGGISGSIVGDVTNAGVLQFDRSDDVTFSGRISGSGQLRKRNANTLTLTADHTYTGGTIIETGTLSVGDGGETGSLQGNVVNDGILLFDRSGSVTFGGNISGTGSVLKAGTGTLALTGANTQDGGTILREGLLAVSADSELGAADAALVFAGGALQLEASLASDRPLSLEADAVINTLANRAKFGGEITGDGGVTKLGSGTLILNGTAMYSGATRVEAGTLAVGDGAHPSATLLGDGGILVEAGAWFGGFGTAVGDVHNQGALAVGNALPALASDPDAEFFISGRLLNSGLVSLRNGVAADHLFVSGDATVLDQRAFSAAAGAYISDQGVLALDVVLNEGGEHTQADQLHVDSVEMAGGPTAISVDAVGAGEGAVTEGDGILLINVTNASAPSAFALADRVVAGPFEYLLFQGGQEVPNGNWYLRSLEPVPEPDPILRPEVGSYLAARETSRRLLEHTLHERLTEPDTRQADVRAAWARVEGTTMRRSAQDGAVLTRGDEFVFHAGLDVAQWDMGNGAEMRVGIMGAYAHASSDSTADFNPAVSQARSNGYAFGAYWSWFGTGSPDQGAYLDGWIQYAAFDQRITATDLPTVNFDDHSATASLEAGYTLASRKGWHLQPQVQAWYVETPGERLVDATDTRILLGDASGFGGRIGLHLFRDTDAAVDLAPFATLGIRYAGDAAHVQFNETDLTSDLESTVYEASFGLQGMIASGWAFWASLGGQWDASDYRHIEGQLGIRGRW